MRKKYDHTAYFLGIGQFCSLKGTIWVRVVTAWRRKEANWPGNDGATTTAG